MLHGRGRKFMNFRKALSLTAMLLLIFCAACGSGEQTRTKEGAPPQTDEARLRALLPNEVAGWALEEDIRFFVEDNLYDLINGAMEAFVAYGFERVAAADYEAPEQSLPITIELYLMTNPRAAFGIYSSERDANATFKSIGAEGYLASAMLNFWAGNHYVKINAYEDSEERRQAMEDIASAIARNVGDTPALPEIALFPTENQVPHSMRYLAQDILGQTYFGSGFQAMYRADNRESRLLVVFPGDENATIEALNRYKEFSAVDREVTEPGDGGFVGTDSFNENLVAIRGGNRIFISIGEASADRALAQIAAAMK